MKRTKILLMAVMLGFGSMLAKEIKTVTVTTEPQMHCANCEKRIKNFFKFEKGIKKIETSVPEQRVTITYDADKTSAEDIIGNFKKINYQATEVKANENTETKNN